MAAPEPSAYTLRDLCKDLDTYRRRDPQHAYPRYLMLEVSDWLAVVADISRTNPNMAIRTSGGGYRYFRAIRTYVVCVAPQQVYPTSASAAH